MKTFDRKDVYSVLNAEDARAYLNKEGYFANTLTDLKDKVYKKSLSALDDLNQLQDYPFITFDAGYLFFLPADKVKEVEEPKKYKPYKDADEFCEHHELGEFIHMRRKGEPKTYACLLFTGYRHKETELECYDVIYLGSTFYYVNELFKDYEFENAEGDFVPFGVEE